MKRLLTFFLDYIFVALVANACTTVSHRIQGITAGNSNSEVFAVFQEFSKTENLMNVHIT